MRETEAGGWMVRSSSRAPMRAHRLGAVALQVTLGVTLGIGLVMTAGAARAGDDEVDQRSFSERFVDGYHSMIRGTTMDNRGIDYRERSPLVVPPSLDLPPPAAGSSPANVTNWPKDPDERQRKAIIAAKKKNAPPPVVVTTAAPAAGPVRPINIAPPVPEPVAPAPNRPTYANDTNGSARIDPVYDQPGDLFKGGASDLLPGVGESLGLDKLDIGNLFGSKKADESRCRRAAAWHRAGARSPDPASHRLPDAVAELSLRRPVEGDLRRAGEPRPQPQYPGGYRIHHRALAPSVCLRSGDADRQPHIADAVMSPERFSSAFQIGHNDLAPL
jgi:hypothetical protein